MAFTPDSTRLIAEGRWGRLSLWTLASSTRIQLREPGSDYHMALAVHPSNRYVLVAGRTAFSVISFTTEPDRNVPNAGTARTVFTSADGRWVILGPTHGGRRVSAFRCDETGAFPDAPAWEADAHFFYEQPAGFVGNGEQFVGFVPRTLVIRDTATGQVRSTASYPSRMFYDPTASADGARLAVRGKGKLFVWKVPAWKKPLRVELDAKGTVAFALHPTRPLLAMTDGDVVKFVDTDTGGTIREFLWRPGSPVFSVAFSPDGALAAAGIGTSTGGEVVVWDLDE